MLDVNPLTKGGAKPDVHNLPPIIIVSDYWHPAVISFIKTIPTIALPFSLDNNNLMQFYMLTTSL